MTAVRGDALTSSEVARATGATHRQLDHWARRGWVTPSGGVGAGFRPGVPLQVRPGQSSARPGSGFARMWAPADVERVRVMVALVRAGFRPDAAAGLADAVAVHGIGYLSVWARRIVDELDGRPY